MKIEPGDKVRVKTRDGEGTATVIALDESGTYRVNYDSVTVDDGEKRVTHTNVPGYAPGHSIRRE